MAQIILNTEDKHQVRRVRRLVRRWFGTDAETVFGEATDNVLDHTYDRRAEVSLHASGFRIYNQGKPVSSEDHERIMARRDREGGFGMLLMAALGATLTLDENGNCVDWRRENAPAWRQGESLAA